LEFGAGASTIFWATKFDMVYTIESDLEWLIRVSAATDSLTNVELHYILSSKGNQVRGKDYQVLRDVFTQDLSLFPELKFDFESIDFELLESCISKAKFFFVDGGPRNLYMHLLAKFVDDDAVIFIDNSDQFYTTSGREALIYRGFKEIEFNSLGPLNHSATSTSVFIRSLESLEV
jgi:hypothetical protein